MVFTFLLLLVWEPSSVADTLQYQSRGNRYEGVKPKPVAGYDIELISVLVDYMEEVNQMPDRLKVKFYLKRPSEVHLTVRELDYKDYYWMDRVKPTEPWRSGFDNLFEWPTQDVIKRLEGIKMYGLGAVARLEKSEPSIEENVAPLIFYHYKFPSIIMGYLFTCKTSSHARLNCKIYKEGESAPLFCQKGSEKRGGRPFTVRWNSSQAEEGSYKLVITGSFLDDNKKFSQTVKFYHRPNVE
jgi:hypothetical protein